mmetsp:Transcript_21090/g.37349  ORF Transcript_21090/g.37349 Transcript_21090/m.37349 type:complete len:248 (-) Transcript_21090:56-799(-)
MLSNISVKSQDSVPPAPAVNSKKQPRASAVPSRRSSIWRLSAFFKAVSRSSMQSWATVTFSGSFSSSSKAIMASSKALSCFCLSSSSPVTRPRKEPCSCDSLFARAGLSHKSGASSIFASSFSLSITPLAFNWTSICSRSFATWVAVSLMLDIPSTALLCLLENSLQRKRATPLPCVFLPDKTPATPRSCLAGSCRSCGASCGRQAPPPSCPFSRPRPAAKPAMPRISIPRSFFHPLPAPCSAASAS